MQAVVRHNLQLLVFVLATVLSTAAFADYVANRIDYVDPDTGAVANYTQAWGSNSSSQVVGNASFDGGITTFNFVYDPASGTYVRIPMPPDFDGVERIAVVTGINDAGVITGNTSEPAGNRGFVLANGVYTFFSHPAWANTTGRTISNPTALYPQGFVVGWVDDGLFDDNGSAGFVYDVARSNFALLDGTGSIFTITHGQNASGQITGSLFTIDPDTFRSRTQAFVFTPASPGDPFSGGNTTLFQINNQRTLARGINNNGLIALAVRDPTTFGMRTYVGTLNAFQLITVAGSSGNACLEAFNGPSGTVPEYINDAGQMVGILTDDACINHGLVLTPAALPVGTANDGGALFNVNVAAAAPVFINVPVALSYNYAIGKEDPRFATVRLPLGIGNNKFVLVVGHRAFAVNAGQVFDFRANGFKKGVKAFRVACIDPAAMGNSANSAAFPTELSFVDAGHFTGTQKAVASSTGAEHGPLAGAMTQAECRSLLLSLRDAGGADAE